MKYDRASLSRLIQAVIDNKPCLDEWDDLVSLEHNDPFTEEMAQRLLVIQNAYSDPENKVLIDENGVRELQSILEELRHP